MISSTTKRNRPRKTSDKDMGTMIMKRRYERVRTGRQRPIGLREMLSGARVGLEVQGGYYSQVGKGSLHENV